MGDPAGIFSYMAGALELTLTFEGPDEEGWVLARVLEVPGAVSQGRTRAEARENVIDALQTVLTPDHELDGGPATGDRESLVLSLPG